MKQKNAKGNENHRVNWRIKVPRVQLIDDEGTNHGELNTKEALRMAEEAELDLVEISPNTKPPICKIMNYGQYKYQQKKKKKQNKTSQTVMKGIRLRPNIAEHDLQVIFKRARKFIDKGNKVHVQLTFKGREMACLLTQGRELLERFAQELSEISKIETPIKKEGRRMLLLLTPTLT